MKKITTIFLLSLMLFNTVGYRFVFSFMEKKATDNAQAVIDANHFSETSLVELRIPLNMPYYSDHEYEVAYGETVVNGKHYCYVKRKVEGNTLYLLCLPNFEKTKLLVAKSAIEKSNSADNEHPFQKNQQAPVIKLLQAEFLVNNIELPTDNSFILTHSLPAVQNSSARNLFIPLTPAQPPEAA